MKRIIAAVSRLYGWMLRLYPRSFRAMFAGEMESVFAQTLDEAARQGGASVLVTCLREMVDFPIALLLEHVHDKRKKSMKLFHYDEKQGIRITRWIARIGGLLLDMFFCFIILTTSQPVLFKLTIVVMTAALLIAWRREKTGGLIMLTASLACALTVGIYGMFTVEHLGTLKTILVGFGSILGVLAFWVPEYLLLGWLFVSLARHERLAQDASVVPG